MIRLAKEEKHLPQQTYANERSRGVLRPRSKGVRGGTIPGLMTVTSNRSIVGWTSESRCGAPTGARGRIEGKTRSCGRSVRYLTSR